MKESQQVEWKSSWRDDYLRWICGFANAEGGKSWGCGIEQTQGADREHGIEPPVYDFDMAGLMLTFRASPEHLLAATAEDGEGTTPITTPKSQTPVKTPVKTPVERAETPVRKLRTPVETPDRILKLLRANPQMTLAEVAEGRLRYVRPRKSGHWETLE
jgi:ATP-dependent DNA helicase RecG